MRKERLLMRGIRTIKRYIRDAIKKAVPTFHEPYELNKKADSADEMLTCKTV